MILGFFLSFLVLFHILPRLSAQAYVYSSSSPICPHDFECKNIGRMRFPFANFTHPDCGLCMVDCLARPLPTIKLSSSSVQPFQVKRKLQNNVLKLHDPTFQDLLRLNYSSCYLFYYNTRLPNSSSISFTIKSNITLFRCSKSSQLLPEVVNYFTTNQFNKNESCQEFDIYYKNPKSYSYTLADEPFLPGCSVLNLPVWENASEDTELLQWLTADFDLEWHLSERCYNDCHLKGGRCETVDTNEFHCANYPKGKKSTKTIIILGIAAGGVVVVSVVILALCFITRKRFPWWSYCCMHNKLEDQQIENFIKNNYGSLAPKRYHYSDLKKITNSFGTKLGEGGYGSVYKGKLQDGRLVAVKVLKETKGNNGEEFINEVESISRTSHVNIVTLLGFCFQVHNNKKALIYEFMTNGSLEKFIYGDNNYQGANNRQLEWPALYRIAVGIARGLEYLHRGCNTRILHFDIKPQNILLDEDFCPKISDFGLAKLCPRGKDSIVSEMDIARGTIGFIAPEIVCKNIGGVSHKSDVYSYGMMVLEMVGGRKNADSRVDRASQTYFPHWIYNRLIMNQGRDDQEELCLLSGIMNEEENKQVRKMIMVSLWCIQTNPSSRPTIGNVLEMLEGPLENIQMPPKPYLYSPSRTSSLSEEEEEGSSPPDYLSFSGM